MGTAGLITFSPRTLPGREWGARSGRGTLKLEFQAPRRRFTQEIHPMSSRSIYPPPPNGVSPHGKQQWESLRELPNVSDPAEG